MQRQNPFCYNPGAPSLAHAKMSGLGSEISLPATKAGGKKRKKHFIALQVSAVKRFFGFLAVLNSSLGKGCRVFNVVASIILHGLRTPGIPSI